MYYLATNRMEITPKYFRTSKLFIKDMYKTFVFAFFRPKCALALGGYPLLFGLAKLAPLKRRICWQLKIRKRKYLNTWRPMEIDTILGLAMYIGAVKSTLSCISLRLHSLSTCCTPLQEVRHTEWIRPSPSPRAHP